MKDSGEAGRRRPAAELPSRPSRTPMATNLRHDRTVRLLEARLEALAVVCERAPSGPRPYDRHILGVAAATRHAVALDLLSPQEAGEIWAGVARRHPDASWCRVPAFA
jgi:hypothetical protein